MADAGFIAVKNFERFQHYKDRNPPWIKLYNELLDDYDFGRLPDASKWLAVGIWLLASRYDNRIPNDPEWIGRRINATEPVNLTPLVSAGFVTPYQDASTPLADDKQPAMPETEGETETEKNGLRIVKPTEDELFEAFWKAYPARTNNPKARARKAWNARRKEGVDADAIMAGLERYVRWCEATGKLDTELVKQAATFLGTDRCWEEPWDLPAKTNGKHGPSVDDILTLLNKGGAYLQSPASRPLAFQKLEKAEPALWARAGPAFKDMPFPRLLDLKARDKDFDLRAAIESQLRAAAA